VFTYADGVTKCNHYLNSIENRPDAQVHLYSVAGNYAATPQVYQCDRPSRICKGIKGEDVTVSLYDILESGRYGNFGAPRHEYVYKGPDIGYVVERKPGIHMLHVGYGVSGKAGGHYYDPVFQTFLKLTVTSAPTEYLRFGGLPHSGYLVKKDKTFSFYLWLFYTRGRYDNRDAADITFSRLGGPDNLQATVCPTWAPLTYHNAIYVNPAGFDTGPLRIYATMPEGRVRMNYTGEPYYTIGPCKDFVDVEIFEQNIEIQDLTTKKKLTQNSNGEYELIEGREYRFIARLNGISDTSVLDQYWTVSRQYTVVPQQISKRGINTFMKVFELPHIRSSRAPYSKYKVGAETCAITHKFFKDYGPIYGVKEYSETVRLVIHDPKFDPNADCIVSDSKADPKTKTVSYTIPRDMDEGYIYYKTRDWRLSTDQYVTRIIKPLTGDSLKRGARQVPIDVPNEEVLGNDTYIGVVFKSKGFPDIKKEDRLWWFCQATNYYSINADNPLYASLLPNSTQGIRCALGGRAPQSGAKLKWSIVSDETGECKLSANQDGSDPKEKLVDMGGQGIYIKTGSKTGLVKIMASTLLPYDITDEGNPKSILFYDPEFKEGNTLGKNRELYEVINGACKRRFFYVYVSDVNLRVDSNNDGEVNDKDDGIDENGDEIEEKLPGKIFHIQSGDVDNDGIQDFYDGFDCDGLIKELYSAFPDLPTPADADNLINKPSKDVQPFVEVELSIPGHFNLDSIKIQFDYTAHEPRFTKVQKKIVDETETVEYSLDVPAAKLRLWTKDKYEARNGKYVTEGGDFIPPGHPLTPAQLGISESNANTAGQAPAACDKLYKVTLYLEGVDTFAATDIARAIKASIDPDGGSFQPESEDIVTISPVKIKYTCPDAAETNAIVVSEPSPVIDASVNAKIEGDELYVSVSNIKVYDSIADNLPRQNGEPGIADIKGVNICWNGKILRAMSPTSLKASADETRNVSFFLQHPYLGKQAEVNGQSQSIGIPVPITSSNKSHILRIETTPNAEGSIGFVEYSINGKSAVIEQTSASTAGTYYPYNIGVIGLPEIDKYELVSLDKTYELMSDANASGWAYLKGDGYDNQVLLTNKMDGNKAINLGQQETSSVNLSNGLNCMLRKKGGDFNLAVSKAAIIKTTKWLVTHDPVWEKSYALKYPWRCKQAALMGNEAIVIYGHSGSKDNSYKAELCQAGVVSDTKICAGYIKSNHNGMVVFGFRTGLGNTNGGAKTDQEGRIYIEDTLLTNGPGNYYVRILKGDSAKVEKTFPLKVGPVMTELATSPSNIFIDSPNQPVDPYSDEFDIEDVAHAEDSDYNYGAGYGLKLTYDLAGAAAAALEAVEADKKAFLSFENAPDDELTGDELPGTMSSGGKHYLEVSSSSLQPRLPGLSHKIKWEGFSSEFKGHFNQMERADQIFMDGEEAERDVNWGPSVISGLYQGEKQKGASVFSSVGEGWYKMKIGVSPEKDSTQLQKFEVNFEVETKVNGEFLK
jgi:hypothetical protein